MTARTLFVRLQWNHGTGMLFPRGGQLLRTASASSRSRRASCSLLGNQLVSQCLRIGDVILVAVRIDPNVWSLRVGLHLLVLAREVEKPTVRAEEDVGGIGLP